MCYVSIALVTDTDAGLVAGEGVTASEVFAVFELGLERLREVLGTAIGVAAAQPECLCARGEHDIATVMEVEL
jgi:5'-methylthioadenosine phosphorylase